MARWVQRVSASAVVAGAWMSAWAQVATFMALPNLDPSTRPVGGYANAVTSDGQWIVGGSHEGPAGSPTHRAVRWRVTSGGVGAPEALPRTPFEAIVGGSTATGVSDDGTRIVGSIGLFLEYATGHLYSDERAASWSGVGSPGATAEDDLTTLDGRQGMAFAGISASGAVAAGTLRSPEYWEPIPWRPMTWAGPGAALEDRHPTSGVSLFRAISRDGTTAVGAASNAGGVINSTIWRSELGEPLALAGLAGDQWHEAQAVSSDGTFVAGVFYRDLYRWSNGSHVVMPGFANTAFILASGVTDDGRRVIGSHAYEGANGYEYEALVWDEARSTRRLKDAMVSEWGLDVAGWTLTRATAMTPDGRVIVGWGVNPAGERQAWRAVVPAPEAPGSCDADANQDGNVDQDDVDYLINAVGGGPNPTGFALDFSGDGNVDQGDVAALLNVVAGGACP